MGVQQDVQLAFQNAVKLFNQNSMSIMRLIDGEASVYSISGQLAYHPKHAIRAYFTEQFQDQPQFNPASLTPTVIPNPTNTGAAISGQAIWTDKNHPAPTPGNPGNPLQILYSFTFVLRQDPSGVNVWLLSAMWGS